MISNSHFEITLRIKTAFKESNQFTQWWCLFQIEPSTLWLISLSFFSHISGITTVLTLSTISLESRTDLPKVHYATALDWFIICSFGYCIATLLEFAGVHYFTKVIEWSNIHIRMSCCYYTVGMILRSQYLFLNQVRNANTFWKFHIIHILSSSLKFFGCFTNASFILKLRRWKYLDLISKWIRLYRFMCTFSVPNMVKSA